MMALADLELAWGKAASLKLLAVAPHAAEHRHRCLDRDLAVLHAFLHMSFGQ